MMKRTLVINKKLIAIKIANDLFKNGVGDIAKRLILELEDGRNGGGWSHGAVVDRIETILKSFEGNMKCAQNV